LSKARADHARWWLSELFTTMAVNFAATHASFSILVGGSILPALKEPWVRTAILVSRMVSALVVRLWAGRRFLGRRDAPSRRHTGAALEKTAGSSRVAGRVMQCAAEEPSPRRALTTRTR